MEDSAGVIAGRGMEDNVAVYWMENSVAVNIAVAKGLLWCATKGNRVSAVFINGRVRTLPLPKGIAERKKSERESSCSCIPL